MTVSMKMKKCELVAMCDELGVDSVGTKPVLIRRIEARNKIVADVAISEDFIAWYVQTRMGKYRLVRAANHAKLTASTALNKMSADQLRRLLLQYRAGGGDIKIFDEPADTGALAKMHKFLVTRRKGEHGMRPAILADLPKAAIVLKPYEGFNGFTNWSVVMQKDGVDGRTHGAFISMAVLDSMASKAVGHSDTDPQLYVVKYIKSLSAGVAAAGGVVIPSLKADEKGFYICGPWVKDHLTIDTMRDSIGASILWRPVRRLVTDTVYLKSISSMMRSDLTCKVMIDDIVNTGVPITMKVKYPKAKLGFYKRALTKLAKDCTPAEFYLKMTDGCVMLNQPTPSMQLTCMIRGEKKLGLGKLTYGYDEATAVLHKMWGIHLQFGDVLDDVMKVKPEGKFTWAVLTQVSDPIHNTTVPLNDQWDRAMDSVAAADEVKANGWADHIGNQAACLKQGDLNEYRNIHGDGGMLNLARKGIMQYIRLPGLMGIGMSLFKSFAKTRFEGSMDLAMPKLGLIPGYIDAPSIPQGTQCMSYRFPIFHVFDAVVNGNSTPGRSPVDQLLQDGDFDGDLTNEYIIQGKQWRIMHKQGWEYRRAWLADLLPDIKMAKYDAEFTPDNVAEFCDYILRGATIGEMDALHSRAVAVEKATFSLDKFRSEDELVHRERRIVTIKKLIDVRKHRPDEVEGNEITFAKIKEEAEAELGSLDPTGEFLVYAYTYGGKAIKRIKGSILQAMIQVMKEGGDPSRFEYTLSLSELKRELNPDDAHDIRRPVKVTPCKSVGLSYRPYVYDLYNIDSRKRFAAKLAYVLWLQFVGRDDVYEYVWAKLPASARSVLSSKIRGIPQVPQFKDNVRGLATKLMDKMDAMFGQEQTKVFVKKNGLSDDRGPVYELDPSRAGYKLGWLNSQDLLDFEAHRRGIFESQVCDEEQRYWIRRLFKKDRPMHWWLKMVFRQLMVGSSAELVGRRGSGSKYDDKASKLGIYQLKAGEYINSMDLLTDAMLPEVALIINRMLVDADYVPSVDELNELVGAEWQAGDDRA